MTHKETAGKPKLGLIPFSALAQIAEVREFGIKKYKDDEGWKQVDSRDFVEAGLRHLHKVTSGEEIDPESGLQHLAHAACSIILALAVEDEEDRALSKIADDNNECLFVKESNLIKQLRVYNNHYEEAKRELRYDNMTSLQKGIKNITAELIKVQQEIDKR